MSISKKTKLFKYGEKTLILGHSRYSHFASISSLRRIPVIFPLIQHGAAAQTEIHVECFVVSPAVSGGSNPAEYR